MGAEGRVRAQLKIRGQTESGALVWGAWPLWPGYGRVRDIPPEKMIQILQTFRRRYPGVKVTQKTIVKWREES